MDLGELQIISDKLFEDIDDRDYKKILVSAKQDTFYDLIHYFASPYYNSNYLLMPNYSYHFMLFVLLFSISEYVELLDKYGTQKALERADSFKELFAWFFHYPEADYVANFVFICKQLRITRASVLRLIIKLTKQHFIMN